ncbi:MAG: hypothetical protein C4538_02035 [Nitrospiraceae bacterium]|nr:MAG: hypothetical protein C4538_02035 [Nitrospiraceae bacterium]
MIFKKIIIMLAAPVLLAATVNAQESRQAKGIYEEIPGFKKTFDGESVEVIEFFSFYCGHCYEFEKAIPVIKGNFPKKIQWKNVPVYWGQGSSKPGEAYLLAEEAGKGEQMKKAIFEAFFIEKRDIGDIAVLESIGEKAGLGFDFSRRLRAGDKTKEANAALIMMQAYKIDETPTLVIAGNLKVNPHIVGHSIESFRDNAITIIKSILNR